MLPNVLQRSASDHVPVLAEEVRELLAVQPGETVVDATFGAGGHSRLLVSDLQSEGKLIAIDRDPSARTYFDRFKARSGVQARFLRGEFSLVLNQLAANDVQADAILLDLGVSSMQLDRPERGFSYAADAPLDMRMDTAAELSARELVNEADERELALIFKRFGEERYARQIARAISVGATSGRSSGPPTWPTRSSRRSRRRRASATAIRPSGSSRRSGSPSTTSSARSKLRSRRRCGCSGRAAASPSSASTRSRTGS